MQAVSQSPRQSLSQEQPWSGVSCEALPVELDVESDDAGGGDGGLADGGDGARNKLVLLLQVLGVFGGGGLTGDGDGVSDDGGDGGLAGGGDGSGDAEGEGGASTQQIQAYASLHS